MRFKLYAWLIHVSVWQNPLQYCKVISLQLKKINLYKKEYFQIMKEYEVDMEKEMATHSSTLAWKIPRMEEPGRLQCMGSRRVGPD